MEIFPRLFRAGQPGIQRVHVGCGPQPLPPPWHNVDIRRFQGVDTVFDVTQPWPWHELAYVYGEHFLEHLWPEEGLRFLCHAGNALRGGGTIRLSTPSLEWVIKTHFVFQCGQEEAIEGTIRMNLAFHGWGHRFLYSREMLRWILAGMGYQDIAFCAYGESADANLRNIERHELSAPDPEYPSVWIVEATKAPGKPVSIPRNVYQKLHDDFIRMVASGH